MTTLSTSDFERSVTWNLVIAAELQDREEASYQDEGEERKWGSLSICRQSGAWYCWAAAKGGHDALSLIRFLRPDYTHEDVVRWLVKFLDKHPGTGQLEAEDEEWTQARREATAARARHYLNIGEPLPPNSTGAAYLASRGLPGPYPEALRWIPIARPGESALIMPLTAFGRITGVMVTYIDALGEKSLVAPARRRLDIERAPGAVMVIQEPTPGVVDISATMIIAEGFENAMSIAHPEVAHPGSSIIGVPGISTLKNVPTKPGDRIIVAQDSDPEGHPAQIGLQAGIDNLILQGAQVRRTERSEDGDANAILLAKGPAELNRLLARPAGAPLKFEGEKLSIEGEIARLAKLSPAEYEKERKKVAKDSEWRVTTLDKAVARLRPAPASADDGSTEGMLSVPEDPAWSGPVPSLLPILDTIRNHFRRFAAITEEQLTAVVLWVGAAHLIHSTKLHIDLFPKLAIESKDPASGKTTLLTLIWNCLPRAKLWTYPTGAYLVRALEQARFSLCLNELQYAEDRNLLRVINASQHRTMAYVPLLVPDHKGAYIPHEYFVWAPMALARLGEFSTAQQSRSIIIWMLPKLPGDKKEHLRRPLVPELADCRRQLGAWADSLTRWIDPKLPASLNNRDVDNWIPLFFVAEQAGGPWPDLAAKAVEELMKTERRPTVNVRLLRSIWAIYQPEPDKAATRFLPTSELLAKLIGDEDEEWDTMGPGGRSITPEWLRERLRNLLDPPGSTRESRLGPRGYAFRQFKMPFARYLGTHPALDTTIIDTSPDEPGAPSAPGDQVEKPSKIKGDFAPGAKTDPAQPRKHPARSDSDAAAPGAEGAAPGGKSDPAHEKPKDSTKNGDEVPAAPGAPGRSEDPSSVRVRDAGEWGWADGAAEQPSAAEPEEPRGNRKAALRPSARTGRAKPNGPTSSDSVESTAASAVELAALAGEIEQRIREEHPGLDLPSAVVIIDGSVIADEIRQLRAANPQRSIGWLARETGQPRSVVRAILGIGEGEQ